MTTESQYNVSQYLNQFPHIEAESKQLRDSVSKLKNAVQVKINAKIEELEKEIINNQSRQYIGTARALKKMEIKRLKEHIKQLNNLNKKLNNLNKKLEGVAKNEFSLIRDFSDGIILAIKESHDKGIFRNHEIHTIVNKCIGESTVLQEKMESVRGNIQKRLPTLESSEKQKIENSVKKSLGVQLVSSTKIYSETSAQLNKTKGLLFKFDNAFNKPFYLESDKINFGRGLYNKLLKEQMNLEKDFLKAKTESEIQQIKVRCEEHFEECEKFISNAFPRNPMIDYEKLSIAANKTEARFVDLKAKLAREKNLPPEAYFNIMNFLEIRRSEIIEAASRGGDINYEIKLGQFNVLLDYLDQSVMKKWMSQEKRYVEALENCEASKSSPIQHLKQDLMNNLNKQLSYADKQVDYFKVEDLSKIKTNLNDALNKYFEEVDKLIARMSEENKKPTLTTKTIAGISRGQDDEAITQTRLEQAQLSDLMSDAELDLIWQHKEKFSSASPEATGSSRNALYNYICGITDINGNVQNIALSPNDYSSYFGRLRSIIDENNPVNVTLQTRGEKNLSADVNEQTKQLTPFDNKLKDENWLKKFQNLPKEHQEYIRNASKESSAIPLEKQKELIAKEAELKKLIIGEQLKDFNQFMKDALAQSTASKGFIHFRSQKPATTTSFERIYIQMNKDCAEELVRLLISELIEEGEYPGVLDIKVAGPEQAGRVDGIVIYIGGPTPKTENNTEVRQKAIKERDNVLKKLKEIQQKKPELFGKDAMPFKKTHSPGIATVPGLSTSDSFTENLSKAIISALAQSKDRQEFRAKIIEAFFAPS